MVSIFSMGAAHVAVCPVTWSLKKRFGELREDEEK